MEAKNLSNYNKNIQWYWVVFIFLFMFDMYLFDFFCLFVWEITLLVAQTSLALSSPSWPWILWNSFVITVFTLPFIFHSQNYLILCTEKSASIYWSLHFPFMKNNCITIYVVRCFSFYHLIILKNERKIWSS